MNASTILKDLVMISVNMSVKEKIKGVGKEEIKGEIYEKAAYLPLLYFLIATPTLLMLLGLSLFVLAAVAQYYTEYFFPTDLALMLGLVSVLVGFIMVGVYLGVLKKIFKQERELIEDIVKIPKKIDETVQGAFAPIIQQLKQEQSMFLKRAFR